MTKLEAWIRRALLSAAGSVGLFIFAAFLTDGILSMSILDWYRQEVSLFRSYVVVPWGMALCLLRLKDSERQLYAEPRWDLRVLFVLLLWIVVPFLVRFGWTFNNVTSWHGYTTTYFGIYMLLSEKTAQEREREFDLLLVLMGILSLLFSGALLYCAYNAISISIDDKAIAFGVVWETYDQSWNLCHGVNYNITGMVAVCLVMLCISGITRWKNAMIRALFFAGAGMSAVVVVLTQSRTARYSMLIALAAGAYSVIAGCGRWKREMVRQAAALTAAATLLFGGYAGADRLTQFALEHYTSVLAENDMGIGNKRQEEAAISEMSPLVNMADTVEVETKSVSNEPDEQESVRTRAAIDGTFSERTSIWNNLFKLWRKNPKYLLIGNGVGRTGSQIVEGTLYEEAGAVAVHNTYLQYTADFGLIGIGLLAAFFCIILVPVLRVFFARGSNRTPGYTGLCMLVIVCLLTGLMESAPLGGMVPMSTMLFFALALLARRGRELVK